MTVGVELTDEDLKAVRLLYKVRWTAQLNTWKERDTDYCLWFVTCPDLAGNLVSETGNVLSDVIHSLLTNIGIFPNKGVWH